MILFSERKKLTDQYEQWLKEYPQAKNCPFTVISFLAGIGRLKSKEEDWIPCEVELPPQPKENPLYENKPLQIYLVSVKNCEEPFRAFWNGKDFTDGWSKLNVEAWMNLPQPYKKEGAE